MAIRLDNRFGRQPTISASIHFGGNRPLSRQAANAVQDTSGRVTVSGIRDLLPPDSHSRDSKN